MGKEKLTGLDYAERPLGALIEHPDYNAHAFRVVQAVLKMNNKQLMQLDIPVDSTVVRSNVGPGAVYIEKYIEKGTL